MRDVASAAGVSLATVSRVVNRLSGVTPETRCHESLRQNPVFSMSDR